MELLEQYFDMAFSAPNGIQKLRDLILTLAFQGKLVAQDPSDTPASQLLKEIEAEKKRLVKEGKIKAPKPLPDIKLEEEPYPLPKGWEWVRLGEIGVWKSGSTPSRANSSYYGGNIPWVKSGEVKQGRITKTEETITELALNKCSLSLNPVGSVLVAMYGANIGEVGILDIEATTNQAICACRTYTAFDERYLLNLIRSLKPYFISLGAGAAQPNISREKIVAAPFPLPPLEEQHRIVAKIDQLMARCDALENLRSEREEKRLSTHTAALSQLLEAQSGDNFADVWNFITQHFSDLYAVKENITGLRKSILQLAVMGKLVPQDPNDPPASKLLKEIEAEKKRLAKEGKIKASKLLTEINAEGVPHEIPAGWAWATLGDISLKVSDGFHHTPRKEAEGIKYISATHIYNGRIDWDSNLFVSEKEYLDLYKKVAQGFGDILIVNRGAGCGDAAIVDSNEDYCFQNAAIIGFDQARLCGGYILRYLHSSRDHFLKQFIQGGAQPMLSNRLIATHLIAIPPFAEQNRIVAKIDQLMSLCDTLEQCIATANTKQTELLNAVMAQV